MHYYTFHSKSEKPVKAVIRPLPNDLPPEDISNGLQNLGFSVLSVKHMTASQLSPKGGTYTVNLPHFFTTVTRNTKSHETFS
jgi:hypothetical protein